MSSFFCCKPKLRVPHDAIIFCDVDDTLIDSTSRLNTELLEALRGREIIFMTIMDMTEVQNAVATPGYMTRERLIEIMNKEYGITVLKVVTPLDLSSEYRSGDGYEKHIKPFVSRAMRGEFHESDLHSRDGEYQACYKTFSDHYPERQSYSSVGLKGALVAKVLEEDEYRYVRSVYFLDDRVDCIRSVTSACEGLKPLRACQVDMRASLKKLDYIHALNEAPVMRGEPLTARSPLLGHAGRV